MTTCPNCNYSFKIQGRKLTDVEKKARRFAKAWNYTEQILKDYNDGYAILWLTRKYESHKRIIRAVLKEKGIIDFRGRKGIRAWNKGLNQFTDERILRWSGAKNPNWKGGVTELNVKVRRCGKYIAWVKIILKRDNWTCKLCGKRGGNLEVDHCPKLFSEIMQNIKSLREAMDSKELWDINNGRTLCKPCHNTTKKSFKFKKLE